MTDLLELSEKDIPGAILSEPFEAHTNPSLRWWLLCRGIQAPTSWKKAKLIDKIRECGETKLVDVDGSYLFKKREKMLLEGVSPHPLPGLPEPPLSGWEFVDHSNYQTMAKKLPTVTPGLLYTYLAEGVGRTKTVGAFRALQRGFIHWSSGRLDRLEVNTKHPDYCHVRCQMTPSMKQGLYTVHLLLGHEGDIASVERATCECKAGQSESCTHVSALLHALVSMFPSHYPKSNAGPTSVEADDELLPVTSYACQWKPPRKRKECTTKLSEATFEKHVYGREKTRSLKSLENYDPRPTDCRGSSKDKLPKLLEKLKGKGLCISYSLDKSTLCSTPVFDNAQSAPTQLPSKRELQYRVSEFKKSLDLSMDEIRGIEQQTRDQAECVLWHSIRKFRITASTFGLIMRRLPSTPPKSLVLQILGMKQFFSQATEWGKKHEPIAIQLYVQCKHASGEVGLYCCKSGFVISKKYPFLGASPDAVVHDPHSNNAFGLAEAKCPFTCRSVTPFEACSTPGFCSSLTSNTLGEQSLQLHRSHIYFSQVQGQMAITERNWCDFIIYTEKGINVERIHFDEQYWQQELLPKLIHFFDNCVAPEVVSPLHVLGLPVRDLSKMRD